MKTDKPRQIDYVHKLWSIEINVVCCHTCPSVFFHTTGAEHIVCPYCLAEGKPEDFSDLIHEQMEQKIDYEMWMFSDLMRCYNEEWKDEDYDVIWEELFPLYEEFEISAYNVGSKSAIDCMHDFLINKYK